MRCNKEDKAGRLACKQNAGQLNILGFVYILKLIHPHKICLYQMGLWYKNKSKHWWMALLGGIISFVSHLDTDSKKCLVLGLLNISVTCSIYHLSWLKKRNYIVTLIMSCYKSMALFSKVYICIDIFHHKHVLLTQDIVLPDSSIEWYVLTNMMSRHVSRSKQQILIAK